MTQFCCDITIPDMNFNGISKLLANLPDFKMPEMPLIPDPLFGDQSNPLSEKNEKISAVIMGAFLKYFKMFILDPLDILVDAFKPLVAAAGDLWDEIINFELPGTGTKFMDFISELISDGAAAISKLIDKIKGMLDNVKPIQLPDPLLPDAKNSSWEALQKVQAIIKESTLIVFKKCMDIFKLVIDKVKEAMDLVGVTLGPPIDAFFEMLSNIPDLVSKGWTALVEMFSGPSIDLDMAEYKTKLLSFIDQITTLFGSIEIPGLIFQKWISTFIKN